MLTVAFNVPKKERAFLKHAISRGTVLFLNGTKKVHKKFRFLNYMPASLVVIWGKNDPDGFDKLIKNDSNIKVWRVYYGPLKNIDYYDNANFPWSLIVDKTGIYFDGSTSSDVERNIHKMAGNGKKTALEYADKCIELFRKSSSSPYFRLKYPYISHILGPKLRERVLVLGEVEDSHQLIYGGNSIYNNVELITMAAEDYPEAQIFYRPPSEYVLNKNKPLSDLQKLKADVQIIDAQIPLGAIINEFDRVYTLSSDSGFEALILGAKVTTIGSPFYAGWGLTEDKNTSLRERRNASPSLTELFVASCLSTSHYRKPSNGKPTKLSELLLNIYEDIVEKTDKIRTDFSYYKNTRFYNLSTERYIDNEYLKRVSEQKIIILTDNQGAMPIAQYLKSFYEDVSVVTVKENQANSLAFYTDDSINKDISIFSLKKRYGATFTAVESEGVALCASLSAAFKSLFDKIDLPLNQDVRNAFSLDFEDNLFEESIRYLAVKSLLNEYKHIIVDIDNVKDRKKFVTALRNYGKITPHDCVINIVSKDKNAGSFIKTLQIDVPVKTNSDPILEAAEELKNAYWKIKNHPRSGLAPHDAQIGVIGNITDKNYAYSPAALRIIKNIPKNANIMYYPASMLSEQILENNKDITYETNHYENFRYYTGNPTIFKKSYQASFSATAIPDVLQTSFMNIALDTLPSWILGLLQDRISSYMKQFMAKLALAAEVEYLSSKQPVTYTVNDRALVSNLFYAFTRHHGHKMVGVQAQIISTCPRYRAPLTDVQGVIDTLQQEIFSELGYPAKNTVLTGATNLADRLEKIKESIALCGESRNGKKRIFFAMQHSLAKEMRKTAKLLQEIAILYCDTLELWVKPHPFQESVILNDVQGLYAGLPNVTVLQKSSDTYEALAQCDLVLGLFSSVIYESIVSHKMVITANFFNVNESVDFGKIGICQTATEEQEFIDKVAGCLFTPGFYDETYRTLDAYLDKNPHLKADDPFAGIDNFIKSMLPGAAAAPALRSAEEYLPPSVSKKI